MAIREGHAFADTVFGKARSRSTTPESRPRCSPARDRHRRPDRRGRARRSTHVDVYKAEFRPMKATLSGREERILMKVLVDGASDRVVGGHIFGHEPPKSSRRSASP